MSHRSPARFLAPLALVAAVATVYLVARSELQPSQGASSTSTAQQATSSSARKSRTSTRKASTKPKPAQKTYTVKPGDVLGSISAKTGVPVEDLLDYNDIDAQSLDVGQKLKLTP